MSGSSDRVIGTGFVTNFWEGRQYFPLVAPICRYSPLPIIYRDVHVYPLLDMCL